MRLGALRERLRKKVTDFSVELSCGEESSGLREIVSCSLLFRISSACWTVEALLAALSNTILCGRQGESNTLRFLRTASRETHWTVRTVRRCCVRQRNPEEARVTGEL